MGSDNRKPPTGLRRFIGRHKTFSVVVLSFLIISICMVVFQPSIVKNTNSMVNSKATDVSKNDNVVGAAEMTTHDVYNLLTLQEMVSSALSSASDMMYNAAVNTHNSIRSSSTNFIHKIGMGNALPRVIVTMTCIPSRLAYLQETIESLKNQNRPPDEIIIHVPYQSRRFKDGELQGIKYELPDWLLAEAVVVEDGEGTPTDFSSYSYTANGSSDLGISGYGNYANMINVKQKYERQTQASPSDSTIPTVPPRPRHVYPPISPLSATIVVNRIKEDHGPATKFIPTINRELKAGRYDSIIVIADDDVYYPPQWLEGFLSFFVAHPEYRGSALGMRGYCNVPANVWDWRIISEIATTSSKLQSPYQVDVITANNGFLIRPFFFLKHHIDITTDTPKSAYYMDDIWINGVLAVNNITKYVIPGVPEALHRPEVQEETETLEDVPIGRAYHNNVLLRHFENYWTNCRPINKASVPEYSLQYSARNKEHLNNNSNPWAHLGVKDKQVLLTKLQYEDLSSFETKIKAAEEEFAAEKARQAIEEDKNKNRLEAIKLSKDYDASLKNSYQKYNVLKPSKSTKTSDSSKSTPPASNDKYGLPSEVSGKNVADMFKVISDTKKEGGLPAQSFDELLSALKNMQKEGKI